MTNTNELRRGNLVYYDPAETIKEVTLKPQTIKIFGILDSETISYDKIDFDPYEGGNFSKLPLMSVKTLSPIPITDGILESCGLDRITEKLDSGKEVTIKLFKEIDAYTEFNFYPDKIIISQKPKTSIYTLGDIQNIELPMPKYLHQLQNLIFYFTVQELEVKELINS